MNLLKASSLFAWPLLVPVLLAGCDGSSETPTEKSPVAAKPEGKKPEDKKVEAGTVHDYKNAGLQFTLPRDWKVEIRTDGRSRMIDSPNDEANIIMTVIDKTKKDVVLDALRADNKKNLDNYKESEEKTETINGMKYTFFTAKGDFKTSQVGNGGSVMKAGILEGPQQSVMISTTIDQPKAEAIGPVFDEMLQSMKKM